MKEYSEISDNDLLKLYHKGDKWAFDEIIERYKNAVIYHARFFFLTGGDSEDLIQEGMIGLFDAVMSYNEEKNASFNTFAGKCIRSRMIKAVESDNKKGNIPLNTSVPIEIENEESAPLFGDFENAGFAGYQGGSYGNPEDIVLGREDIRLTTDKIKSRLSEFEGSVFEYFLAGMNYREIAGKMGVVPKSIDNALHRIIKKVRALGEEEKSDL